MQIQNHNLLSLLNCETLTRLSMPALFPRFVCALRPNCIARKEQRQSNPSCQEHQCPPNHQQPRCDTMPGKEEAVCGWVNALLPQRILLKAGKQIFHPSCCTVELFQGICIDRVGCANKAKMREVSYPALALNSTDFQIMSEINLADE